MSARTSSFKSHRVALILGIFLVGGGALYFMLVPSMPSTIVAPRLATANAYDSFIRSATLLTGPPNDYLAAPSKDVAKFLAANTNALATLRAALPLDSLSPTAGYGTNSHAAITNLAFVLQPSFLLQLEARLACEQTNYDKAADIYLDLIRYGQQLSRGVLLDLLTGLSVEKRGLSELATIQPHLSPEKSRLVAQTLLQRQHDRETFGQVLAREKAFSNQLLNHQLGARFILIAKPSLTKPIYDKAEQKYKQTLAQTKSLAQSLTN